MSQLQIRNDLLQGVIDIAPVPIVYENSSYDPTALPAFISFSFFPVTSETLAKPLVAPVNELGFIQLSVFIQLNSETYDNQQLEIIDTLKTTFYHGAIFGSAQILEVTVNGGQISDGWFKRDLTVNYMSYQER